MRTVGAGADLEIDQIRLVRVVVGEPHLLDVEVAELAAGVVAQVAAGQVGSQVHLNRVLALLLEVTADGLRQVLGAWFRARQWRDVIIDADPHEAHHADGQQLLLDLRKNFRLFMEEERLTVG